MSRIKKWLMAAVMAVGMMPVSAVYAAGGLSVSTGSLSMTTGGSASFTVSVNDAAGRVDISSSNAGVARVSVGSTFLDNSSVTIVVTGASAGSAVITVRATDMTTYDDESLTGTTRTVSVNVSDPAPAPAPAPTPTPAPAPASTPTPASTPSRNSSNNSGAAAATTEVKPEEEVSVEEEPKEESVGDVVEEVTDGELSMEEPLGEVNRATSGTGVDGWMIVAIVEMVMIMIGGGLGLGIYFRGRKHSKTYQMTPPTDSLTPQA